MTFCRLVRRVVLPESRLLQLVEAALLFAARALALRLLVQFLMLPERYPLLLGLASFFGTPLLRGVLAVTVLIQPLGLAGFRRSV